MKNETHRLGDYIREVNVRNRDLKVTRLMGLNMKKEFIPSVANVIGTDFSSYKIVRKGQFGCVLMKVGRDGISSIALLEDDEPIIISGAYYVFEVKEPNVLLPEYLMLWIRRPEFDRILWFKAGADVRGSVSFEAFCDMPIYVPSIERQREIVSEYETLTRRIRLNEQMIEKLEATAQALYRHTFVDNIDKQNLPQGWHLATLGEVATIKGGKRLPKGEELQEERTDHPYIKVADMCNSKYVLLNSSFQYVNDAVQNQIRQYIVNTNDIILSIVGTIGRVNVIDESLDNANLTENCVKLINLRIVSCHYLYAFLSSTEGQLAIEQSMVGGVQAKLPIYNIEKLEVMVPSETALKEYDKQIETIDNFARAKQQESSRLAELQGLLLARMGCER